VRAGKTTPRWHQLRKQGGGVSAVQVPVSPEESTKGRLMKILTPRWWLAATLAVAVAGVLAAVVPAGANAAPSKKAAAGLGQTTGGLGQLSGLLPRNKLTEESAIQVNLSNETVRLPLYPGIAYAGTPRAEKVWYVLLDASDSGLAHDLGVNYAPKLANIAISYPAAVQTDSRWPSSSPAPWPAPGTARSSRSPAPTSSTTRPSSRPATARST
jgi:hypothetical protein